MTWLHAVVDRPRGDLTGARFWQEVLGWSLGPPRSEPDARRSFEPDDGDAYVHLQEVDGPPAVHLEVEVDDVDLAQRVLVALGADVVPTGGRSHTLCSPGGMPFRLVPSARHRPPRPVTWDDEHSSRVVQVCVDCPAEAVDTEVAFWRGAWAGRWVGSDAKGFVGKLHDDAGSPLQLLFQQVGTPGPVQAHLDLGSDDASSEVGRLADTGAEVTSLGPSWVTMVDPLGQRFCVTRNSPEQDRLRDLG